MSKREIRFHKQYNAETLKHPISQPTANLLRVTVLALIALIIKVASNV